MNAELLPPLMEPLANQETNIGGLLEAEAQTLTALCEQITNQIATRVRLSQRLVSQLEGEMKNVRSGLMNFPELRPGETPDSHRLALEQRLTALQIELRQELAACWREAAPLHEEHRRTDKERQALIQQVQLFSASDDLESSDLIVSKEMREDTDKDHESAQESLAQIQACISASRIPSTS